MITLFIVLVSGIVIKCVGVNCDTTSTAAFAALAAEGGVELVFVLRGILKIFAAKGDVEASKSKRGRKGK